MPPVTMNVASSPATSRSSTNSTSTDSPRALTCVEVASATWSARRRVEDGTVRPAVTTTMRRLMR
jgi:hypothetical protein